MHCVTDYPVKEEFANLACIDSLRKDLKLNIGYSDHTKGILAPLIAVSKGATVIEKHFTLDRNMDGPDHLASLSSDEFRQMSENIRSFEILNGKGVKKLFKCEIQNKKVVRKSLVARKNIKKGEKFTYENITTKRPGKGICASKLEKYIGAYSKRNYIEDDLI